MFSIIRQGQTRLGNYIKCLPVNRRFSNFFNKHSNRSHFSWHHAFCALAQVLSTSPLYVFFPSTYCLFETLQFNTDMRQSYPPRLLKLHIKGGDDVDIAAQTSGIWLEVATYASLSLTGWEASRSTSRQRLHKRPANFDKSRRWFH